MSHPARAAIALLGGLLVQLSILDLVRIADASPDLVLAGAAAAGLVGGAERGALAGFLAGLALDLASSVPFGLAALTGVVVGYSVGAVQRSVVRSRWWLPVSVVAAGGVVGTVVFAAIGELLGRVGPAPATLATTALVVGVCNGALAPLVLPVARWALDAPHPRVAQR